MSLCTSIEKLTEGAMAGYDLLRVTLDDKISAYWFYNYADAMAYLNQEVIVEFRQEMYKGQPEQFVNTFVMPTQVNTLSKEDNIKLFLDQVDNQSNVSFQAMADGDTSFGAIVYCSSQEFKSSASAVWMELIIRDKSMHTAKLRIFDYADKNAKLAGNYILGNISKNKYGFNSDNMVVAGLEVRPNPEIDIAISFIKAFFAYDVPAMDYINKLNLIDVLKEVIDHERGYTLVRMAMELAMADSLKNITDDINLRTLGYIILTSYGHYVRKSPLSASFNNIVLVQSFAFSDKAALSSCLDESLEEHPDEYIIYKKIKSTVDSLITIRKGSLE